MATRFQARKEISSSFPPSRAGRTSPCFVALGRARPLHAEHGDEKRSRQHPSVPLLDGWSLPARRARALDATARCP